MLLPPIRTDHSNAFAHNTMRVRLPAIIDEVLARNPDYPAAIQRRAQALSEEIASGAPIPALDSAAAPDFRQWEAARQRQRQLAGGDLTWHNAEWFFAETYAYRCLVAAVRWRENGRDPFLPHKREELQGAALWQLLETAGAPAADGQAELARAVEFALWGNRIDLSYAAAKDRGTAISRDDLLVDDRADLLAYMTAHTEGAVIIVADNAGSELAMDLALIDCLLRGGAERVMLYLKVHPTFVSDATPVDFWQLLTAMAARGGNAAALAGRLRAAWGLERLRVLPHPFWNSSDFLWQLPLELRWHLNRARLVIIKGDANYRRALGDCIPPAHTATATALSYLDAPLLCLRTLKSDPVIGLPSAALAAQLDQREPDWRVNGKYGLIQFKARSSKSQ